MSRYEGQSFAGLPSHLQPSNLPPVVSEKPLAAVLRENELLRSVAAKAITLRRIGMAADECDETLTKLWDENPDMPRSGTQHIMMEQAFKTAMVAFDLAVLRAANEGMDWAKDHGIPKPVLVNG